MRLLIIGGAGNIGKLLLAQSKKTVEAHGTSSGNTDGLIPFRLERPNEFDYQRICAGDVTLLTGAISSPDTCSRDPTTAWAINVTGTSTFIENVIDRGGRVIFFSSDAVYGERNESFHEGVECSPVGEYARMKYEVERRFLGDPSFKTIRLSYVFSREDTFSRYLAKCVERNEEAELFHPFFRAIVHRDDVVEGALALAFYWDQVACHAINFGGPQLLSRVDFAETLRETYLPNLRYRVAHPGDAFFRIRPGIVSMTSPVFADLLGRPTRQLLEAARLEFATLINEKRGM